jgi:Na+/glutamate symporter
MIAGQIVQFLVLVLVGFPIQFYLYVVVARLVGEAYAESLEVEGETGPVASASRWQDGSKDAQRTGKT